MAKPSRRWAGYLLAGMFSLPAIYVLLRVHPRSLPAQSRGSILGDVDSFLAQVPDLSRRFEQWATPRGFVVSMGAREFERWIWKHREEIGSEWPEFLPLTTAAYGEALRAQDARAVWRKRSGDAVVEIPGRPWTRRKVAVEVHDIVFTDV